MEKNQIKAIIIVIEYRIVYSALKFMFEHLSYYFILNIHSVD